VLNLVVGSLDDTDEEPEVAVVETETARQFPDTLNGIEFRAVGGTKSN
jgi:hypothetical protein